MPSELQQLIFIRKELIGQPNTFKNRRLIKKTDKKIKKVVHSFAKEQADKLYDKMYDLCYSIVNANFQ